MRRFVVLALFLLSGVAGLMYQVVWTRNLSLVLGVTSQAVATVLAVFMGGLALGSWLLGRVGDTTRAPLRLYGWLEIGIALFGFQTALLFDGLADLYVVLRHSELIAPSLFPVVRVGLAGIALLGPTTLMGATLPILIRAFCRTPDRIGRESGRLYAINTIGAVLGTLFAAYVMIEAVGLRATILTAAAINLLVGLVALWLARGEAEHKPAFEKAWAPPAVPAMPTDAGDARTRRAVLLAFAASGFLALSYEVLWTRYLIYVVGENSVYAFATMLAAFLIGIALGSAIASVVAERVKNRVALLGCVIVLIGAAALVTVAIMTPLVTHRRWTGGGEAFWLLSTKSFIKCLAILIVPTTLSGSTFAIVAKIYARNEQTIGRDVGRAYAMNTLGAIFGALAGGFLVLPHLGLRAGLVVLGALNVLVGLWLLMRGGKAVRAPRAALVTGLVAVLAAGSVALSGAPEQVALPHGDEELVFYEDGPESSVAVLRSPSSGNLHLLVDGDGQAGTWSRYQVHLRLLGHLAPMFHPDPKDALVVAFGAGVTTGCLAQHPIERVDLVELSDAVLRAAPWFAEANHDALNDPKLNVIRDDGRNYLLATDRMYDVITSDPIDPDDAGVTSLYSKEYYELVRSRLRPGGVACQWMTSRYDPADYRLLVRTFQSVFPNTSIWFADFTTVLVGMRDDPSVTMEDLRERMADPKVAASLAAIGVDDAEDLLSLYIAGPDEVRALVGEGPYNSDDRPYIEYQGPRFTPTEQTRRDLWKPLMDLRSPDLSGWIADWSEADREACADEYAWMDRVYERLMIDIEPVEIDDSAIDAAGPWSPSERGTLIGSLQREARSARQLEQIFDILAGDAPRVVWLMTGLERPDLPDNASKEQRARYAENMPRGVSAWSRGDWDKARQLFEIATRRLPEGGMRARLLEAICHLRLGDPMASLHGLLALDMSHEDRRAHMRTWPHMLVDRVLADMAGATPEQALEIGRALCRLMPDDADRPPPRGLFSAFRSAPARHPRPPEVAPADVNAWRLWWSQSRRDLLAAQGAFVWTP
jgi:spermidine synthase